MNPKISIVSTLYRSSGTIEEFIARSVSTARQLVGEDFEVVLVDDGSPDDSVSRAESLMEEVPQLVVVELTRNFGHHLALLAGLEQSSGELVFLIDSDLEEEPEWLTRFIETMQAQKADVVYGFQEKRKGGVFEKASGALYWKALRSLSGLDIPSNIVTCRLMTREYVDALLRFREVEVSIGGLFALAGFRQEPVKVAKASKGSSTYSLRLKVWHLINSVTSFSTRPLEIIFVVGLLVTMIGVVIVGYLIIAALAWSQSPVGWASVMASLWLIGGLVIASLGVMAIYLGKVFLESKHRPRTLVRRPMYVDRHGKHVDDL